MLSGQRVEQLHLGAGLQLAHQLPGVLVAVSLEADRRHDRHGNANLDRIQFGDDPSDGSVGLESADAPLHRGCRESDEFTEIIERATGIFLQQTQQRAVDWVHETSVTNCEERRKNLALTRRKRNRFQNRPRSVLWVESASILLTVAVVVANLLGVGMLVPQTARILRRRDLDGVSAEWIGMGLAVNAGWLVYAYLAGIWGLVGVSAGALLLYAAMAFGTRRVDTTQSGRAATTALVILNVLGWATAVGQAETLGLTLAALFTVQFAPAAWSAWTSATLTGISATTWVLALGETAIWIVYGTAIGDAALLLGGIGASTMALLVLMRLWLGPSLLAPEIRPLDA